MSICPISAVDAPPPATPEDLFRVFDALGIPYSLYHHPALFTVRDGLDVEKDIPGSHCRNLFLRDPKERMFIVTALNETTIDLKKLPTFLPSGRLSFGSPERLVRYLGIRPGSVCPFSVMNDTENAVQIVLDSAMMEQKMVNYHPLINTMTVGITPADLLKFLDFFKHDPLILDLPPLAIET